MLGSAILGVLVVCMNVTIALVLYRTRRTSLTGRVDKEDTRDTESKLFFLTCIMFSFTMVTAVIQVRESNEWTGKRKDVKSMPGKHVNH